MKRTKKKFSLQEWIKANKFYLLAFILPVASMLVVFAFKGVAPFGNLTYLRSDCYHQYTPYLEILQNKLRHGGNLLYTWQIGGGMNFIAIIAYYLASPANILTLIWPTNMADITDFFIVVKMGLAGFSMTYFLTKRFGKEGAVPVAFGMAYALSAYFAAFSWNIMWLDCMWLLPFIILGLERLVREGKFLMYCVALALGIFSNYYIGIMLCLFSVCYFIYLFAVTEIPGKEDTLKSKAIERLKVVGKYALYSLISGGLSMMLVLPEYFNLMLTKSADTTFPTEITEYFSMVYIFFRSLITIPVADLNFYHEPNVYASVAVFIVIPLFWLCKKISIRERVGKTIFMLFMLLSLNINVLDYIWHGFHFPNSLPCRESFVYIFLILTMGYEGVLHIKELKYKHIIGATGGAIALLLLFEQIFDKDKLEIFTKPTTSITMVRVVFLSIAFIVIYAFIMCLYKYKPKLKNFFAYIMILVLFCELTINMQVTSIPSTSDRDAYYNERATIEQLSEIAKKQSDKEGVGFYRSEMKDHDTRNNGARYNYNSISTFSSVSSAAIQDYYSNIGMQTSFNAYSYLGHTPLTASLFSVKYEFANSEPSIPNDMTKIDKNLPEYKDLRNTGNKTSTELYEYNKTLPLGFVIDSGTMSNWDLNSGNPFITQNSFVKSATGLEDNIFHQLKAKGGNAGTFTAEYDVEPDDNFKDSGAGPIDVYFYCQTDANSLTATVSGKTNKTCQFSATDQNYICHVGDVERGSTVTVTGGDNKNISSCYAFAFDEDAWQSAFDVLNSQPLKVTEWKDTKIKGTIDVKDAGLLYTSIPYEEGWSIYVDGKKVEPGKICKDALIGISVIPGKHTIEFSYVPKGFIPGIIITFISLVLLIFLVKREKILLWMDNKKRSKTLNK